MEEAVSGVKGALATKVYGDDLKVLEEKSDQIVNVMRRIRGVEDLGVFRVLGPAQFECDGGPGSGGALPDQRRGCAGCDSDGGGRECADAGVEG